MTLTKHPPTGSYKDILDKLERAEKHFADFESLLSDFRLKNPDAFRAAGNRATDEFSYYIVSVPAIPNDIRIVVGDALQNLRSVLDYLIWAILQPKPLGKGINQIGFPIFETAAQYEHQFAGKVPGAGKLLKEAIDRIKPYKAGNLWLWRLHRLNIKDKHRLLLAAAFVQVGRAFLPSGEEGAVRLGDSPIGRTFRFVMDRHPPVPLKAGDKLFTVPYAKAKEHMHPILDVAFNETGISEGLPIYLCFRMMHAEVKRAIRDLAGFIKS